MKKAVLRAGAGRGKLGSSHPHSSPSSNPKEEFNHIGNNKKYGEHNGGNHVNNNKNCSENGMNKISRKNPTITNTDKNSKNNKSNDINLDNKMANNGNSTKIYNKPKSPFLGWRKLKSRSKGKENKKPQQQEGERKTCETTLVERKIEESESPAEGKHQNSESQKVSETQLVCEGGSPNPSCLDVYERLIPTKVDSTTTCNSTRAVVCVESEVCRSVDEKGKMWTPYIDLPQIGETVNNERNNRDEMEVGYVKDNVPVNSLCGGLDTGGDESESGDEWWRTVCEEEEDEGSDEWLKAEKYLEAKSEDSVGRLRGVLKQSGGQGVSNSNTVVVLGLGLDQYLREVYHHLAEGGSGWVSVKDVQVLCRVLGMQHDIRMGKDQCRCLLSIPSSIGSSLESVAKAEGQDVKCPAHLNFPQFRHMVCEAAGTETLTLPTHRPDNPRLVRAVVNVARRGAALEDLAARLATVAVESETGKLKRQMLLQQQEAVCLREVVEDLRAALQSSDAENLALRVRVEREDDVDLCLTDEEDDLESLLQRLSSPSPLITTQPDDATVTASDSDDGLQQQLATAQENLAAAVDQQEAVAADLRAAVRRLQVREAALESATSHSTVLARQAATARAALSHTRGRLAAASTRLTQLSEARRQVLLKVSTARNLVAGCLDQVRAGERALTALASPSPYLPSACSHPSPAVHAVPNTHPSQYNLYPSPSLPFNTSSAYEQTTLTQQPSHFTQQPSSFAQQSSIIAQQPSHLTKQPSPLTQQPSVIVQQPSSLTQQLAPQTQEPSHHTQQSSPLPQKLSVISQQPLLLTQQPLPFTQHPSPQTQQPSSLTQQLSPFTQQPSPQSQQPSSVTQQPSHFTGYSSHPSKGLTLSVHDSQSSSSGSALTSHPQPSPTPSPPASTTNLDSSSRVDSGLYSEESERDDDMHNSDRSSGHVSASEDDLWSPKESVRHKDDFQNPDTRDDKNSASSPSRQQFPLKAVSREDNTEHRSITENVEGRANSTGATLTPSDTYIRQTTPFSTLSSISTSIPAHTCTSNTSPSHSISCCEPTKHSICTSIARSDLVVSDPFTSKALTSSKTSINPSSTSLPFISASSSSTSTYLPVSFTPTILKSSSIPPLSSFNSSIPSSTSNHISAYTFNPSSASSLSSKACPPSSREVLEVLEREVALVVAALEDAERECQYQEAQRSVQEKEEVEMKVMEEEAKRRKKENVEEEEERERGSEERQKTKTLHPHHPLTTDL